MDKKFLKKEKKLLIFSSSFLVVAGILFFAYYYLVYVPYVAAYENSLLDCKTLSANDKSGINLVFFGSEEQSKKYSDFLFSVSPLKYVKNNFNVYYIDDYSPQCEIYRGVAILCYSREVLRKAASCPNDYVIVLSNQSEDIRSSSYLNVMSINTEHPLTVLQHEFGHAFGNFAEEYTPATIPKGSKNCQDSCSGFESQTDGCFKECSNGYYFRTIQNGVMRTLSSKEYGIYDENLMMEIFRKKYGGSFSTAITGNAISAQEECKDRTYYEIEVDASGNVARKTEQTGCPSRGFDAERSKLIFTDAPPIEESAYPEELPSINGETFVPTEVNSIVQIPSENINTPDKTLEISTVVTKAGETSDETGGVASDSIVNNKVSLSGVEVVKSPSVIDAGRQALVAAKEAFNAPSLSPEKTPSVFEIDAESFAGNDAEITRVANISFGNVSLANASEENLTGGKENAQAPSSSASISQISNIAGSAVREFENAKNNYFIFPIVLLVAIAAIIYFRKKFR